MEEKNVHTIGIFTNFMNTMCIMIHDRRIDKLYTEVTFFLCFHWVDFNFNNSIFMFIVWRTKYN